MKKFAVLCSALAMGLATAGNAIAASFTAGDVVIYRVNTTPGSFNNGAVFLDEYTPAGVLVQSIAMPTAVSGLQRRLTASTTINTEGLLTRSTDRKYLVLTGYDAPLGTASVETSATSTINRIIGRVGIDGVPDTSTVISSGYNTGAIRSAANNGNLYTGGAGASSTGGVRGSVFGAANNAFAVATDPGDVRQVNVLGGQLMVSAQSTTTGGTVIRLGTVGTGAPTTNGQAITTLPGITQFNVSNPYAFAMTNLNGTPTLDTLYVADDGALPNNNTAGIRKFSFVSGTWIANGYTPLAGVRGLAIRINGGQVQIFATTTSSLVVLNDSTTYNVALTATVSASNTFAAPTNTSFRGVALTPDNTYVKPAPFVDLDGYPSSVIDTSAAFTEGPSSLLLCPNATVSADTSVPNGIFSMTATLNQKDGINESLGVTTTGTSISQDYNTSTGVLTLTGSGSAPEFQRVLRTLRYRNSSDNPSTASRSIVVKALGTDSQTSPNATITLSVTSINDAPVVVTTTAQTTNEDTPLAFGSATNNLVGFLDYDDGGQTEEIQLSTAHGTITLKTTSGLTFSQGDGTADATMTFRGTIPVVQDAQGNYGPGGTVGAALEGFTYTPDADYFGSDALTLSINDLGHTGNGGALSATDSVAITVNSVNDAPSFTKGADQTVTVSGAVNVPNWATNLSTGPANESGQALNFIVTNDNNALFNVQPAVTTTGVLTYTPSGIVGSATVTVKAHDNGGTANGGIDTSAAQTFTITAAAPNSVAIASASVYEGNTGSNSASFTVTLAQPSAQAVTVDYSTSNGTAIAGSDYTAASGTLTIPAGQTSATIPVGILGDFIFEPNENYLLTLYNPSGAQLVGGATTLSATGTILNDDNPPTITIAGVSKAEGQSGTTAFDFKVSLSAAVGSDTTISYATADGTATSTSGDYTAATGTLTIPAGSISSTITVLVNGDTTVEGDETFALTLTNPTGGAIFPGGVSSVNATGTLVNDDNDVAPVATDVSDQIQLYKSGLSRNKKTGRWVMSLVIQNNGATLNGALALAFDGLLPGVDLYNADGYTSRTAPTGSPYRSLTLPGGALASGTSVNLTVEFVNPSNGGLDFTPRFLQGPGTP